MPTPTIKGTITLSTEELERALKRAQEMGERAAGNLSRSFVAAGAQIAVAAAAIDKAMGAAKFLAAGIAQAYELGGALAQASARTGIMASQLAVLNRAAQAVGIADLSHEINLMQRNLEAAARTGKGPAAQALAALGVNVNALLRQQPAEQMQALGRAINAVADPAKRTADAMAIFGRAGAELLPLFENEGAIGQAVQTLGRQAAILGDNAQGFKRVAELFQSSAIKVQGFFVGAAAQLEGKLLPLLERFDKMDFAGLGKLFGDGIIRGVDFLVGAFQHPGELLGLFWDAFSLYERHNLNELAAGFRYAGDVLMSTFHAMPEVMRDVTEGLGYGLLAAGEKLEAALLRAVGKGMQALQAGMDWVSNFSIAKLGLALLGKAKEFAEGIGQAVSNPFQAVMNLGAKILKAGQQEDATTLTDVLTGVVQGKGLDYGIGKLDQRANANMALAQARFSAGGAVLTRAVATPKYEVRDVAGAGAALQKVKDKEAEIEARGKQTTDKATAPQAPGLLGQPGYGNQRMPVSAEYVRQLRSLYGPEKANEMLYDKGTAEMLNKRERDPVSAAYRAQLYQLFGADMVNKQMLDDDGRLRPAFDNYGTGGRGVPPAASHSLGTGTALDFDPSTRPGWTGARDAFAGFTKNDWANYRGTSGGAFKNGTSLTTGGLGGGAYGHMSHVLTQLSGRVGGSGDPAAATAKNTASMAKDIKDLVGVWTGKGSGSGVGGGATVTR